MTATVEDIVEEATRLVARAAEQKVVLRLIGGLAVRLHSPNGVHPAVRRAFEDIDFASTRKQAKALIQFFEAAGYESSRVFNTMNAGQRLLFHDSDHERRVDVFLGSFEMCHKIPLDQRIEVDPVTIPLAELLLTKLQIVELNEKDLQDILALLNEHEVADHDLDAINGQRIADLCARDWGLWRTCTLNFEQVRRAIGRLGFEPAERSVLVVRLETLAERIESRSKSRAWKLRARVGDRKRWYEEPQEVG